MTDYLLRLFFEAKNPQKLVALSIILILLLIPHHLLAITPQSYTCLSEFLRKIVIAPINPISCLVAIFCAIYSISYFLNLLQSSRETLRKNRTYMQEYLNTRPEERHKHFPEAKRDVIFRNAKNFAALSSFISKLDNFSTNDKQRLHELSQSCSLKVKNIQSYEKDLNHQSVIFYVKNFSILFVPTSSLLFFLINIFSTP